jgi:DNA-binding NarL/FixJ family response regulator
MKMEDRTIMQNTAPAPPIKVFIVDDHPLVRNSLRELIADTHGLCPCGEAESCEQALQKIPQARPDLVILDLGLRGPNGFELLRSLRKSYPRIQVLVLSMLDEDRYALRAIKEGARGYVMKTSSPEEILNSVFEAAHGKLVVSQVVQQQLLADVADPHSSISHPDQILSGREWQVFECLGRGLTIKQSAEQLLISEKTASSYCERIKTKLKATRLRDVSRTAQDWLRNQEL